jgi:hypothetical protein
MRRTLGLVAAVAALALPGGGSAVIKVAPTFDQAVTSILAEPYQPNYVPAGTDMAFPWGLSETNTAPVPNTAPAQDYTSGSIPGDPDHPSWPKAFADHYVRYLSGDGAPLWGYYALHPGSHPGIVVVHGFNTNGKESVIRWAAMLYAEGYDVFASDQRDYKDESNHNDGYPDHLQTFGWKESQDVLAAGAYLKALPGVTSVGVLGFSEGAQNTVLALANDTNHIFSAGLTFSAPADQNTQIYSTAAPSGCQPPNCQYPATDALVNLVVPPYGNGKYYDVCTALTDAASYYHTTNAGILAQEKAYHAQTAITVPLLNFYAQDDSLVGEFQAKMMAGYEGGHPLQRTIEIQRGEHAYFFDRWWDQRAILFYFKGVLPGAWDDGTIAVEPTVQQTPGGAAMSTQLVDLGSPTQVQADALGAAPLVCPGSPTAVTLRSFSAVGDMLRWRTASEVGVAGFAVVGPGSQVTVRARGGSGGASYGVRVTRAGVYRLVAVRLDGSRVLLGRARVLATHVR